MRRSLRRCALASGPLLREVLRPYVETTCVARNDFTTNAAQLVELIGAKTVQRRGVQRLPRLDDRAAPAVGGHPRVAGDHGRQACAPVFAILLTCEALQRVAGRNGDRRRYSRRRLGRGPELGTVCGRGPIRLAGSLA